MEQQKQMIPLSIMVAGVLIAGAIYFGGRPTTNIAAGAPNTGSTAAAAAIGVIAPVAGTEHVLGDPSTAKLTIVEYSDLECPFCKVFHNTLHQIVSEHPGEIAWVFRNFPIAQLHSKAPKEAEAAECAASLGGNDTYWKFIDEVFSTTNSNNSLDPAQLPKIAADVGLDVAAFNNCLSSGQFTQKVQSDVAAAGKAGAQGTPYSIVIDKSGNKTLINGAQPLAQVEVTINNLLK